MKPQGISTTKEGASGMWLDVSSASRSSAGEPVVNIGPMVSCRIASTQDSAREETMQREKKIMFQRVALTFYDTAYVRSQAGADKRNNPSLCKYRKKPYFSFFECRSGRRWGL